MAYYSSSTASVSSSFSSIIRDFNSTSTPVALARSHSASPHSLSCSGMICRELSFFFLHSLWPSPFCLKWHFYYSSFCNHSHLRQFLKYIIVLIFFTLNIERVIYMLFYYYFSFFLSLLLRATYLLRLSTTLCKMSPNLA